MSLHDKLTFINIFKKIKKILQETLDLLFNGEVCIKNTAKAHKKEKANIFYIKTLVAFPRSQV